MLNRLIGIALTTAALGALAACQTGAGAPVAPAASASATPSVAPSELPATALPTPTPTPAGDGFREDFNAPALNAADWHLFEQGGVGLVRDGAVDLLSTASQTTFPYLVSSHRIVPEQGAFAFEVAYRFAAPGRNISFCLDYLPPEQPGEDGLTAPFMRVAFSEKETVLTFDLERQDATVTVPVGTASAERHTLGLTYNGAGRYVVLFDGQPVTELSSQRRPEKFWVGVYPQRASAVGFWPRVQIDAVSVVPR